MIFGVKVAVGAKMNKYKGFRIEELEDQFGKEYLCYWRNTLAGGTDTERQMIKLIDTMVDQGVKHESLIKVTTKAGN